MYQGANRSLAQTGRKQATATILTFASHSRTTQKVVRPTRSPWQQWPTRWTKNGDLSIVFFNQVGLRTYQHPCIAVLILLPWRQVGLVGKAALPLCNIQYPLYRWPGGPQGWSRCVQKISNPPLPPTGIQSPDCPGNSEWLYRLHFRVANVLTKSV